MTTAENCQEQVDESSVCCGGNGGQNGLETEGGSRAASQSLPRDESVGPEAGPGKFGERGAKPECQWVLK